jgi:hypothetical protein
MARSPKEKGMSNGASYIVTLTDDGSWMHAPGSDFLFAFISKGWDSETQSQMKTAFESALKLDFGRLAGIAGSVYQAVDIRVRRFCNI